jgi:copper chaperone CopZ
MKEPLKNPTVAEISALAYQLYVEDGKPEGQAEIHWHRAEDFLRHPEDHSPENLLSPPSEPEITRSLDARAEELDTDLPSDPRSGPQAYHQHVDFALDKQSVADIRKTLKGVKGVESVEAAPERGTVRISFDARRTNPAAIIELLTPAVAETL